MRQRIIHALVMFTSNFLFLAQPSHAGTVTPESASQQTLQPGMTVDQHNWQVAEQGLPLEILRLLQAGDFSITVQETTDFHVRPASLAATANTSQVALDGGTCITASSTLCVTSQRPNLSPADRQGRMVFAA